MSETDSKCAAKGAPTISVPGWEINAEMRECVECGCRVRWDLVDSHGWGFKAMCDIKSREESK